MSAWTSVTLGDVCEFKYGKSLPASAREPGPFPVYGSNGQVATHTRALTSGPTIVIGRKGSFGEVHRSEKPCWPIDTTYYIDETATDADLTWLTYRLRGLGLTELNRAAAIPGLNREDAYRRSLLLPPLHEQRRIAAILDHADALRAKRRQVLAHLGSLPQAIFHEMFGAQSWPRVPLREISEGPGQYGAGVPSVDSSPDLPRYVRITDITDAGELSSDARSPGGEGRDWQRHALKDGDLLFARSGATVGKTYRYRDEDGPCVYAGYLIRFRPNRHVVHPDFVMGFTKTADYRGWVAARQNVVAQPNINAKQYGQELLVPVPPRTLQDEFTKTVEAVREQTARVKRALQKDDDLFASLQSRAFRGEL